MTVTGMAFIQCLPIIITFLFVYGCAVEAVLPPLNMTTFSLQGHDRHASGGTIARRREKVALIVPALSSHALAGNSGFQ